MTQSKKDKALRNYICDIDTALQYQKEDGWLESAQRITGYIDNKYPASLDTPYTVNTFLSLLLLIVPNLYYTDPVISVDCVKEEIIVTKDREVPLHIPGYLAASLQQDILNAIYPRLKVGQQAQSAVQNGLIYGWGAFKVGITTKEEPDRELPTLAKKSVFVSSVNPEDLLYDPMATGNFDDCAFIAHRFVKEVDELKKDKSLDNTDVLMGHSISDSSQKGDLYKAIKNKSKRRYATCYEYHDQLSNKVALLSYDRVLDSSSPHAKKKATEKDEPLLLKEFDADKSFPGSKFTLLRFLTTRDRIRGVSLLASQEDEALAINQVLTLQVRHLAMFGGVFVYERGFLTEDQLISWQSSRQGDMLEVEPNTLSTGRVRRESPLQMGADYFNAISSFHQLIDRNIGIPDFQQLYQTKRKTATESAFEQGDSRVRRDYLLSFVKDAICDVSRKVLALIHAHYSLTEVEELVGYPVPKDLWEAVSDIELYQLDLDVESMIVYNQSMATGLMQALTYLSQNPVTQPEIMKLDGAKIAQKVFKGFGANIKYFLREDAPLREEQNPERENDQIDEGRVIPSPQPFEDHQTHLSKHKHLFIQLTHNKEMDKAQRLMEHMQMHEYMLQSFQALQGNPQAQPPASQGQGGNVPLNNPAAPVPDQAELQGNFRRG